MLLRSVAISICDSKPIELILRFANDSYFLMSIWATVSKYLLLLLAHSISVFDVVIDLVLLDLTVLTIVLVRVICATVLG